MKPQHPNEVPNQIWNLTDWDIAMLSTNYIQKGLLFKKPATLVDQQDFMENLLEKLKRSLSLTLSHFYPLALVAESPTKPKTLPLILFSLIATSTQRPTRSPIPPKSLRSNHYQRLFGDPTCRLAANNRSRILWKFNSCSECRNHDKGLLEKGLGWAAWKLHQAVARVVLQSLKVCQAVKEVEALLESDEEFMNAVSKNKAKHLQNGCNVS
ncbi:hypothetical protein JHK85_014697 [Glycine max]|nr:hypothetical protein JHK85_014697 [Glycine max]